jgi:hypothetical protein
VCGDEEDEEEAVPVRTWSRGRISRENSRHAEVHHREDCAGDDGVGGGEAAAGLAVPN